MYQMNFKFSYSWDKNIIKFKVRETIHMPQIFQCDFSLNVPLHLHCNGTFCLQNKPDII